jgi:hypothetical protein
MEGCADGRERRRREIAPFVSVGAGDFLVAAGRYSCLWASIQDRVSNTIQKSFLADRKHGFPFLFRSIIDCDKRILGVFTCCVQGIV